MDSLNSNGSSRGMKLMFSYGTQLVDISLRRFALLKSIYH